VRTLIVATMGLLLSGAFVFAFSHLARSKTTGAIVFIAAWLIFCVFDYSNGVKGGYPAIDELGIHILIFVVPATGAWIMARFLP
jgi:hypothetical protein